MYVCNAIRPTGKVYIVDMFFRMDQNTPTSLLLCLTDVRAHASSLSSLSCPLMQGAWEGQAVARLLPPFLCLSPARSSPSPHGEQRQQGGIEATGDVSLLLWFPPLLRRCSPFSLHACGALTGYGSEAWRTDAFYRTKMPFRFRKARMHLLLSINVE
jgi:hypothetical protein